MKQSAITSSAVSSDFESSSDNPVLVKVPKGIVSAHINPTKEIDRVLVLTDLAWRPNDNEMENINFEDYDWKKWNV
jgi:dTDP-4-dehydrorhamnose 3,5-epimerase